MGIGSPQVCGAPGPTFRHAVRREFSQFAPSDGDGVCAEFSKIGPLGKVISIPSPAVSVKQPWAESLDCHTKGIGRTIGLGELQGLPPNSILSSNDGAANRRELEDRWWVLHTRPRTEKLVAEALSKSGVAHFLPIIRAHHTYAKSKVVFEKPLFPGYVFLRGRDREREIALKTNRLVSVIAVADQSQIETELANVRKAIASDSVVELYPAIRVGTHCRVIGGALRGLEGQVVSEGGRSRLYLAVTLLGQSAVLEIDAGLLERVG